MFFTQEDYRKIEEYLKQNSKKDTDFKSLDAKDITPEDYLAIVHDLQNRKVNVFDLLSSDITGFFAKERELLNAKIKELEDLIKDFTIEKVGLTNEFGDSQIAAVSQKALTEAFHKVWSTLGEITGEVYEGINMTVTPDYFISEDGTTVHITANTVETNGIFERIQFFVDGEKIYEAENTEYVSFDHHLDNKETYDYVVMCKAKILGIEYTRQQVITRYNEFYIGAGTDYTDIMNAAHAKQLHGRMRNAYDVTFEDDDQLIIVMGASLRERFIRADLNGAEIEMTEETVTIDDKDYVVFTSEPWSAGNYNIDING